MGGRATNATVGPACASVAAARALPALAAFIYYIYTGDYLAAFSVS